jgi:uncharacterized membrane protein
MFDFKEFSEVTQIVGLAIGLLLIWLLLRNIGKKKKGRKFGSLSDRNLRNRYLRGEISKEEYEKQKKKVKRE